MDDRVVSEDPKDKADPVTTKTADQWGSYLEAIKSTHDVAAFEALFGHFAPRIKSFLLKSGADANLAEECAQEVMVTVWNKAHLFDPTRASAATWIFTIARNKKIDALRKASRPEPDELPWGPDHEPDQADVIALQQETDRLGRALAASDHIVTAVHQQSNASRYMSDRMRTVNSGLDRQVDDLKQLMDHMQLTIKK